MYFIGITVHELLAQCTDGSTKSNYKDEDASCFVGFNAPKLLTQFRGGNPNPRLCLLFRQVLWTWSPRDCCAIPGRKKSTYKMRCYASLFCFTPPLTKAELSTRWCKTKKVLTTSKPFVCICGREGIQTPNLLIRSQMLYSVELRNHDSRRKYTVFSKIQCLLSSFG